MLSALDKKLVRDVWRMRGQMITIALVVACGVAVFVAAASTYVSLLSSKESYYAESRFADVFATLRRAPLSLEPRLRAISGVAELETRLVTDVAADVPGVAEPAAARMVSLPATGSEALDRIHLRRGRRPDVDRPDEVVVSEAFAIANRLGLSDRFAVLVNQRRQRLSIVGIALSPEYVYAIRPGELTSDDRHYGIVWIGRAALAAALDMKGSFNDVAVVLEPGTEPRRVAAELDRLLAPYGGLGAYPRAEQLSNNLLSQEITQLRANATTVPAIFLGVAAFLLNVVLGRLIGTQRDQIAALKALGYSNLAVGTHYMKLAAGIVIAGSVLGAALGAWMGYGMTRLYTGFFRFPVLDYRLPPWLPLLGAGVSLAAASVGALGAVRRAVRLAPAEAMHPSAPTAYRPSAIDRWLSGVLDQQGRMIVRNIERRPARAILSSLGVAFAVAIVVVGSFSQDGLDYLMDVQFRLAQREDATVTFTTPRPVRALRELAHVPGVQYVEGLRAAPMELAFEQHRRRVALIGVPHGSRLRRVLDVRMRATSVPPTGLVLSRPLGNDLGVHVGQSLTVTALDGERKQREVVVRALVDDLVGLNATMDAAELDRTLGESQQVSLALLRLEPGKQRDVYAKLKALPAVAGVTLKTAAIDQMMETMAHFITVFNLILVAFASVIAVGIVYNGARIALSERAHELASLRVLGFTRGEISVLLLGELGIELLAGLPLGMLLGYGFAIAAMSTIDPHYMRMPAIIAPGTYAYAIVVVTLCGIASALLVRRRLDRLDLVAVLKARE